MSKIFFGNMLIFLRLKSIIWKYYFKLFGMNINGKIKIWKKPLIRGYLNKITIGDNCSFDEFIRIIVNKEGKIEIGNNTLISSNVNINAGYSKVIIGNNTMIASNTYIINSDHDINDTLSVKKSKHITKDIIIEDNVWIGSNCTILKGVTIMEGAIVGAGSVVTKDLAPYSINFGNPCTYRKNRFSNEVLKKKLIDEGYCLEKINNIINKRSSMEK